MTKLDNITNGAVRKSFGKELALKVDSVLDNLVGPVLAGLVDQKLAAKLLKKKISQWSKRPPLSVAMLELAN